jgi:hypothetical protein
MHALISGFPRSRGAGGVGGGWGPGRLMPQTNALRVGQLTSGALAIRFTRLVPEGVSTACRSRWVQESHLRESGWVAGHTVGS